MTLLNPWKFVKVRSIQEDLDKAAEELTSSGYEIVQIITIPGGNLHSNADEALADGIRIRVIRELYGYMSTDILLVGWKREVGDCSLVPGRLSPVKPVPPLDIS